MHNRIDNDQRKHMGGFSLLEVLISLIILSIGLLGLAALQATSLKANHGAYQRSQAIFLAYDMMDRMRANRTAALAGSYNRAMGDAAPTPGDLATRDVNDWLTVFVNVLLPAGDGSIACSNATNVCTVVVAWDEGRLGGTSTASSTTIQFSFSAQI